MYESRLIADLADQLKRGPTRLRLRQLRGIDFLLTVIAADHDYPFDFIVHALTNYRGRQQPTAADATLDGGLLARDLATLAEDLSEDAAIPLETWPYRADSVSELAERFNVSTKTIFRWRRRGLVGWRFRCSDRRLRLLFPEHCVRRFVAAHVDLVNRGANFSQLSKAERARIIARATELVEGGERTVNAVAKTIADETGRAVETVRLILKHYDEAHPQNGLFNRPALDVPADDRRLAVWEAYNDGASIASLAERFDAEPAWIYDAIREMRARSLKAEPIEYMHADEFDEPDIAARIENDPALAEPYDESSRSPRRVPSDLPPYLQHLFRLPLLTREGEAALFRRMNYLKCVAARRAEALEPETATAIELDEIEDLLEEAGRVKSQIVQANVRLVVSIAKKHMQPGLDFFEVVSDGNMSLMRAVERFDYSRGFKFSTYASWAIMKNYARSVPEQRAHRDRYQTGREELLVSVAGPTPEEHESDQLVAMRRVVERMLDTLDEREQRILRQRYGLDGGGQPMTLEQVGREFGVSKERIRQLEARAMARLRTEFPAVPKVLGN